MVLLKTRNCDRTLSKWNAKLIVSAQNTLLRQIIFCVSSFAKWPPWIAAKIGSSHAPWENTFLGIFNSAFFNVGSQYQFYHSTLCARGKYETCYLGLNVSQQDCTVQLYAITSHDYFACPKNTNAVIIYLSWEFGWKNKLWLLICIRWIAVRAVAPSLP